MPTKGYSLDPLQTDLVKEYTDNLVPLVTRPIIIESLKSGVVPAQLKLAIIVLILKKSVLMNFRPICNLPFFSKILQKVVLGVNFSNIYLTTSFWKLSILPIERAIAWRPQYWVSWTICWPKLNWREIRHTYFAPWPRCCVRHARPFNSPQTRLEVSFGIKGNVLAWFTSYVSDRFQYVTVAGNQGGRKRLPKFKFSAKFPIGLHVILQIQIKKNPKWLLYYVKNDFNWKSVEVQRWTPLEIMLNGFCL